MRINKGAARIALGALLSISVAAAAGAPEAKRRYWASDNGNGTYSNPLFYEEFSDPDMIRVGTDYYLTGTTMHTMPGLPVLHSKDMVNWKLLTYAFDRLDLGPDFRLEDGKNIYGGGIWAPCFRYHDGTFYIFANVNRFGLQVFRATNPAGPWKHNRIEQGLHDLSVLFDDDGKIYAVYGATTIRIVEMNKDLTGVVPGTDRVLIDRQLGMGEGSHIYKLKGKYYIVSAIPGAHVPMKCARADSLNGPWEVKTISALESLGIGQMYRLSGRGRTPPFQISKPDLSEKLSLDLHQGGIVDTPSGEWWGFSMQDHNGIGRCTSLSPVTWEDGWPYFGLPGNLARTPSTWVKPNTGAPQQPIASPFERSDSFAGPKLANVWQWNHVPDDSKWSLKERPGYLRLHSLPAKDFWTARNSLTQRGSGPESTGTADLDASGLKPGDVAGVAILNLPYSWLGVSRDGDKYSLEQYDQATGKSVKETLPGPRVWLRVHCNFDVDTGQFSYSTDGKTFKEIGPEMPLPFQLTTFQGVRYSLFAFNTSGSAGGQADFNSWMLDEARPRGLTKPIPYGKAIAIAALSNGNALAAVDGKVQSVPAEKATNFVVVDRGKGRIALRAPNGQYVSVSGTGKTGEVVLKAGAPGNAETFQWVDVLRGDTMFMSLVNHRYIIAPKDPGDVAADSPGPVPDRKDGSGFSWKVVVAKAAPAKPAAKAAKVAAAR